MNRLLHLTSIRSLLVAAGAVLTLTSGAQAQLDDGVPSDSSLFGTVIDLPGDTTPAFNVPLGDPAGASLTQININPGTDFTTGRMYSFCEINFFAPTDANSGSQNANFVNSEVNVIEGVLGLGATIGPNSTLNLTSGTVSNLSTISGVANATGGRFTNFTTVSGTLNISGDATVSTASTATDGAVINASGNCTLFGMDIEAGGTLNLTENATFGGSTIAGVVNMSGGTAGFSYTVQNGGVFNLMGGEIGTGQLTVEDGGTINHTGGNLGFNTDIESGGVLNISGGSFGASIAFVDLDVADGGTVNFTGTEFLIDGAPIAGLTPGTTVNITDRGVLTGTLVDGSPVEFNLSNGGNDIFAPDSTVTVTIASSILLGDVNLDGVVDFLDISPFIVLLSTQAFQLEADINEDGTVDFLDISPFIVILSTTAS